MTQKQRERAVTSTLRKSQFDRDACYLAASVMGIQYGRVEVGDPHAEIQKSKHLKNPDCHTVRDDKDPIVAAHPTERGRLKQDATIGPTMNRRPAAYTYTTNPDAIYREPRVS